MNFFSLCFDIFVIFILFRLFLHFDSRCPTWAGQQTGGAAAGEKARVARHRKLQKLRRMLILPTVLSRTIGRSRQNQPRRTVFLLSSSLEVHAIMGFIVTCSLNFVWFTGILPGEGPIGTAITTLSLPFVIIFLYRICPPAACDHQMIAHASGDCAKNATACPKESRAQYATENCLDKCMRGLDFSPILQLDLFSGLHNLLSWDACLLYAG